MEPMYIVVAQMLVHEIMHNYWAADAAPAPHRPASFWAQMLARFRRAADMGRSSDPAEPLTRPTEISG